MLVETENIKLALGKQASDRDALIQLVAVGVSAGIEAYLGDAVERTSYTETLSTVGGFDAIVLNHGPVITVSSVTIDGDLVAAADYVVESQARILRHATGSWPKWRNKVVVAYEAGYETIPPAIEYAALTESVHRFRELAESRVGISSRTSDLGSDSFSQAALLPSVRRMLSTFRRLP